MEDRSVLFPVMTLIGWTLLVLLLIPVRRFKAGSKGLVTGNDFKYGESGRVPGEVSLPNRNFMNLLEAPLLFYVVCILHYVTFGVIYSDYQGPKRNWASKSGAILPSIFVRQQ
jgi:hypothetical protein